jgi:hypothetical protein
MANERPELSARRASITRAWPAAALVLASSLCACGSAPKSEQPTESTPKSHGQAPLATADVTRSVVTTAPSGAAPAAAAPITDVEKALEYDPKDPLGDLESADAIDRLAHGGAREKNAGAKPPAGGCVVVDEGRRVWPAKGPSAIAAVGGGDFVVAGYATRDGREQLFVVRVPPDQLPEPVIALDISPALPRARTAAPGLAVRDVNDISVATIDGAGKLIVRRLRLGRAGHGAPIELATGVDARFAPAVAQYQNRTLVAWTAGTTPMRTLLARVSSDDTVLSTGDLTPPSMGAAAPTFVSGASPPVLVAVDARNGMSPLLRIDFGADAVPQAAQVALPLSIVSAPPQLAAASSSIGTYAAFAGMGSAATSAVGLVAIAPIAGTPSAIVKGTAYGPLYLSAAAAPRALIFAADAPTKPGKEPPHEIHVHVVGMQGPGAATVLHGPGTAEQVAIARDDGGDVGVVFSGDSGVYVARLRCDDGA